ncbi:MAG: single-stranded DNA-binding protein [Pseudonocardiaceae bacterium]
MRETPVTIVGTVVNDLRPKRVGDDAAMVVNFRMAANERRYDRDSGTWFDGDTLYMTVVCWRRLAENVVACVSKGDPVMVTGKLRTREYEGKDGENRSVTEMEASAVGPDLARCAADLRRPRRTTPAVEGTTAAVTADEVVRGDVGDLAATGPLVPAMA